MKQEPTWKLRRDVFWHRNQLKNQYHFLVSLRPVLRNRIRARCRLRAFGQWLEFAIAHNTENLVELDTIRKTSQIRATGESISLPNYYRKSCQVSYKLIGAMSEEGLIATMTFPGSLNTASCLVFVEEILLPQLWIGAIVVMDNLPVHYPETTKALIESVSSFVKLLPTYSPDLSPIELNWSKLKEILRSAKTRTWDALDEAITMAVNVITDENALNWFNHCGLFFEPI